MTKKATELDKFKFDNELNLSQGLDISSRTIRITGCIGYFPGEDDFYDFNLLDISMSKLESISSDPITLKINSPGGGCYEALAMIGRMKASKCEVITEAYGHCMSAATLVLMAGDVRRMSRYCVPMFHKMSYGAVGSHDDIKEQVDQAEKEQAHWASYYEEFSNKPKKFWLSKMTKKDYYPTPDELLKFGAIDEII